MEFCELVGLLAPEAPRRKRKVIQRRRSNRVRSEGRFRHPLGGKVGFPANMVHTIKDAANMGGFSFSISVV